MNFIHNLFGLRHDAVNELLTGRYVVDVAAALSG
jgi:hypothetical protein